MDDNRYQDKRSKLAINKDGKFIEQKRGRPPKYDSEELIRKWTEYQSEAFWNDEKNTIQAFCKKEGVGYDTMRRALGRKPKNSLKEYPKKSF